MGLFNSVKQFLGIGTVSVKLTVEKNTFHYTDTELKGKLELTAKSDQEVLSVDIYMNEDTVSGSGEHENRSSRTVGHFGIGEPFSLKKGEVRVIDFTLNFSVEKTTSEGMMEKGGVTGVLGSAFSKMSSKPGYHIRANVDVKDVALDPIGIVNLRRMY